MSVEEFKVIKPDHEERINWSKIPYISYDWKNDSVLEDCEKQEIEKAYNAIRTCDPESNRYKYLYRKIYDKLDYVPTGDISIFGRA